VLCIRHHGFIPVGAATSASSTAKGTDGRRHVAAVCSIVDGRLIHGDLRKRVIDVGVAARGRTDNARFSRARKGRRPYVELAPAGVGDPIAARKMGSHADDRAGDPQLER